MADYSSKIWNYLLNKIGNKYGVAGLMGNLKAESNLQPNNLQNSYESSLGFTDESYTKAVDNGSYSESSFVNDSAGYGLAQWTYYNRKQALYNMYKSGGYSSIGSIDLALDYLWYELQNSYSGVLAVLKSATSVRTASDKVLHDFENPKVQDESVEIYRCELSTAFYNQFAGTSVNVWLRTERAESGSRFYNNASGGGISTCINGKPVVSGYNVLCNCVGLAWGAFFETWYHNDETSYNNAGGFNARVNGDGGDIVNNCKTSAVLKDYVIADPSKTPPKGGLIVWGGTANHVAYIGDVSEDGNTITIHQSAYGGASWENSAINGINGAWQITTITRNNKGTNLWWYQNTGYEGARCEGFVSNPGVVLGGGSSEPSEPEYPPYIPPKKKKKGYNFLLFQRNRRTQKWTSKNF